MDGFLFSNARTPVLPRHNASMLSIAAIVHVFLFAAIIGIGLRPVRVSQAGLPDGSSIGAYVSQSVGTVGKVEPKPQLRKKPVLTTNTAKAAARENARSDASAAQTGVASAAQSGSGPVRLGSSNSLNLITRVEPNYPPVMRNARMTGQVVLDAVIHADGTIGEVTVLQSTNGAFAQSAIEAVKRWRYAPPGFEAILTVTVNYTLT